MAVSVNPTVRVFNGGVPVSNAKIYVYQTGTTTPVTTYSDGGLSSPNTNPVITDVNGEATIYVASSTNLRYYITTSAGALIKDIDPVYPSLILTGLTASVSQLNLLDSSSSVAVYASSNNIVLKSTNGIQLNNDQPIRDSSGNEYIIFSKTANAVNQISIANSATGQGLLISASGDDTNIDLLLQTKGTGALKYSSANTSIPLVYQTGTTLQHVTNVVFPNTAATRTVTYPDSDVNLGNIKSGAAKTLVNYGGVGSVTIRASFNTSSVTYVGTGSYVLNHTTAFSSSSYTVVAGVGTWGAGFGTQAIGTSGSANKTTSSVKFDTGNPSTAVNTNFDEINIACFGDQ